MRNESAQRDDDGLELVTVADPPEARMIEEMLNKNNIQCVLKGDLSGVLPAGALDDIQILVQPRDVEQAKQLVEAFFSPVEEDGEESGDIQ
jgi:hypothetical protein